MRLFIVYILASRTRTLYVGITSDLSRRLYEHQNRLVPGFTAKYNVDRLVHYEVFEEPLPAIAREKQLKLWRRAKKIRLIEATNPDWRGPHPEI